MWLNLCKCRPFSEICGRGYVRNSTSAERKLQTLNAQIFCARCSDFELHVK